MTPFHQLMNNDKLWKQVLLDKDFHFLFKIHVLFNRGL